MAKILLWKYASFCRKIVGVRIYTKLQSSLKFYLSFRHDYSKHGQGSIFINKTYVYMIDGKTRHGGLSDRLRGAFGVWSYCKKNGFDFKICWVSPFSLEDYLMPASFDWHVDKKDLSYNLNDVAFKFINTYTGLNGKTETYHEMLQSDKKEVHVYSNVSIEENRYAEYFKDLFVPAPSLQQALNHCKEAMGGGYVSITFRFIGLLGDFKDDDRYLKKKDYPTKWYVDKCLQCVEYINKKNPDCKVLVTSDSSIFLNKVKDIQYVYIVPGSVIHMDNTNNADYNLHQKSFLDFLMISEARISYKFAVGNMFEDSKFAYTASLIGGHVLEKIVECYEC